MEIEQKSVGGVAIRFLSGPLVEKTITIQKPVTIIGRDPQSDIVVFDPRVSRRHACIRMINGSWSIENLSQSSYITINQQQIQQGVLQNNNVVGLGEDTSFVFLVEQSNKSNSTIIEFYSARGSSSHLSSAFRRNSEAIISSY